MKGRIATNYHIGLFEWTHFKALGNANLIFILVKNVIEKLKLSENDSFEFKIKDGSTLEGEFQENDSSPEHDKLSLVKGTVSVYSDNAEKNQVWVVFKCTSGDPFRFREVFDDVVNHHEVQEYLPIKITTNQE